MSEAAVDVETAILEAAQEEFARQGFHGTVVSDIADRAGVGKGTVYRHFGRKSELFGALLQAGTAELHEKVDDVIDPEKSPEEQLRDIMDAHFDLFEKSEDIFGIVVNEGLQRTGELQSPLVSDWEQYNELIAGVFAQGIEQGVFRPRDHGDLAWLYQGLIWSVFRMTVIFGRADPRKRYRSLMLEIFFEGIRTSD